MQLAIGTREKRFKRTRVPFAFRCSALFGFSLHLISFLSSSPVLEGPQPVNFPKLLFPERLWGCGVDIKEYRHHGGGNGDRDDGALLLCFPGCGP